MRSLCVLATLLFLLCFSVPMVLASDAYVNGYRNSDGYSWYDGYWWWGNDAYSRMRYYYPPQYGYYNGCYSCVAQGYYYYQYSFHHTYTPVSHKDVGWRSRLLDIAAERDKTEMDIRKGAFEQAYFVDAVRALGLEGNFKIQGYGMLAPFPMGSGYGYAQGPNLGSYGANASTVYGTSYQTISNLYGTDTVQSLYQAAARQTENAQRLAGDAAKGFGDLVGQEGGNRAKVAEILAKGAAIEQILKSIDGNSAKIETKSFTFKVQPDQSGKLAVQQVQPGGDDRQGALVAAWQASATARCVKCHSGANPKGKFDVTAWPNLDGKTKLSIVTERLLTRDPNKIMPRNADGGPGETLQGEELKLWLSY